MVSLQAVFWAVSPDYEKILQNSSDPRKVEDRKWLAFTKSTGKASLGIVDYKFEARKNLLLIIILVTDYHIDNHIGLVIDYHFNKMTRSDQKNKNFISTKQLPIAEFKDEENR